MGIIPFSKSAQKIALAGHEVDEAPPVLDELPEVLLAPPVPVPLDELALVLLLEELLMPEELLELPLLELPLLELPVAPPPPALLEELALVLLPLDELLVEAPLEVAPPPPEDEEEVLPGHWQAA